MLNHPFLLGIVSAWSWYVEFYQHVHEFNLQGLVWVILCLCLLENLVYSFLTYCALIWFWYQSDPGCVHWSSVPSFFCGILLWNSLRSINVNSSFPSFLPPSLCVYTCLSVCLYTLCRCPWKPKECVRSPGFRVLGGCELLNVVLGTKFKFFWRGRNVLLIFFNGLEE